MESNGKEEKSEMDVSMIRTQYFTNTSIERYRLTRLFDFVVCYPISHNLISLYSSVKQL